MLESGIVKYPGAIQGGDAGERRTCRVCFLSRGSEAEIGGRNPFPYKRSFRIRDLFSGKAVCLHPSKQIFVSAAFNGYSNKLIKDFVFDKILSALNIQFTVRARILESKIINAFFIMGKVRDKQIRNQ